jgi:hypothetical protein
MAIVYECPYELWDYDSGNCLGVYRTRQEAERERDAILAKYGHNLPESRVMIYCDGEDEQAADYTARTALGAHGEGE